MNCGYEVWLYGSRARGDADSHSDTDVLAVADRGVDVEASLRSLTWPSVVVSRYSWAEIEAMRSYGSLFLHHLALEGKLLTRQSSDGEGLNALLAEVPRFRRAGVDHERFCDALNECQLSLERGGWPDFECEVVAGIARHAAILGSYCVGNPAFGRERPFWAVGPAVGYAPDHIEYLATSATAWRKRLGRRPSLRDARHWLGMVSAFLHDLGPICERYNNLLH